MLKTNCLIKFAFILAVSIIWFGGSSALAGICTPGIPCTGYDINTVPNANTDPSYNALKSGISSPYTETSCDANFMNQIYSRAYMEASREVITSQQIIHKPDSVLEYTCFDQYIAQAAHEAGPIFTETTAWQNRTVRLLTGDDSSTTTTINTILPSTYLDDRLALVILPELRNYINNNFSHSFMGEAVSVNNNLNTTSILPSNYNCDRMGLIWNVAKCIDFGEDDRFRSFEHLVTRDPRSIPRSCTNDNTLISSDAVRAGWGSTKLDNTDPEFLMDSGGQTDKCPAPGGETALLYTKFSNDLIRLANNCDNLYSSNDLMAKSTYAHLMKGVGAYLPGVANPTGVVLCQMPFPTGVPIISYSYVNSGVSPAGMVVVNRSYNIHYDYVCPNPGCYFLAVPLPYVWGFPIPNTVPVTGGCWPHGLP